MAKKPTNKLKQMVSGSFPNGVSSNWGEVPLRQRSALNRNRSNGGWKKWTPRSYR